MPTGVLTPAVAAIPGWLQAVAARPEALEDVGVAAGAAIALLDTAVRRQERWAGAWRALASRPVATLVGEAVLAGVTADLGSALDEAAAGQIGDEIQSLTGAVGNAVAAAADALAVLQRHDSRATRELGPWLADAVLAGRLGWWRARPPVTGGRQW